MVSLGKTQQMTFEGSRLNPEAGVVRVKLLQAPKEGESFLLLRRNIRKKVRGFAQQISFGVGLAQHCQVSRYGAVLIGIWII